MKKIIDDVLKEIKFSYALRDEYGLKEHVIKKHTLPNNAWGYLAASSNEFLHRWDKIVKDLKVKETVEDLKAGKITQEENNAKFEKAVHELKKKLNFPISIELYEKISGSVLPLDVFDALHKRSHDIISIIANIPIGMGKKSIEGKISKDFGTILKALGFAAILTL